MSEPKRWDRASKVAGAKPASSADSVQAERQHPPALQPERGSFHRGTPCGIRPKIVRPPRSQATPFVLGEHCLSERRVLERANGEQKQAEVPRPAGRWRMAGELRAGTKELRMKINQALVAFQQCAYGEMGFHALL